MSKELTKEIRIAQDLSGDKVELTREGKVKYEAELNQLVNKERAIIAEELKEARAQGDLSENADYDAAKTKQGEIESRIAEIESILSRTVIISERKGKSIKTGSTVQYVRDGKTNTIKIVGKVEVDPNSEPAKIGANAPIAEAMMGLEEGQSAEVKAIKSYKITVKKIL